MKTPVCEADAKSGVLCSSCQDKLTAGQISSADVELSRILYKYREQFGLDHVQVDKAVDCGKLVVIATSSEAGFLIGRGGKVASVFSKEFGKPVKIIQKSGDLRKMVEELILPVRVLGVNEVFKTTERAYRIRIKRSDAPRLPLNLESINTVLAQVWGEKTTVTFE